jgi:hypothetical protein
MKHTKTIFFPIFLICLLFSQITSAQVYSGAESAEYDQATNRYLVSNTVSKQILARAADGTLSVLTTLPYAPFGLEIVGDTLYCCTDSYLYGINKFTGATVFNQLIGSGAGLNGITHDPAGNLYITALNNYFKKIYKFNTATRHASVFVSNTVAQANGIIYDPYDGVNPRLLVVMWGFNAAIKAVNMADSSLTTLLTTTFSNIEGIAKGKDGYFYLSMYSNNSIQRYDSTFANGATAMVTTGISGPADIYFNHLTDTLVVPNSTGLNFYHFGTVTAQNSEINKPIFNIYPNPSKGIININSSEQFSKNINIHIIELATGKLIFNDFYTALDQNICFQLNNLNLASGCYVVELKNDEGIISRNKLIIE